MWKVNMEYLVGPSNPYGPYKTVFVSRAKTEQAARRGALDSVSKKLEKQNITNYEIKIVSAYKLRKED